MEVRQIIDHVPSELAAKVSVGIGAGGITLQWVTQFGSVLLIVVNLLLAVGGLIVLWPKVRAVLFGRRER